MITFDSLDIETELLVGLENARMEEQRGRNMEIELLLGSKRSPGPTSVTETGASLKPPGSHRRKLYADKPVSR